MTGILVVNGCFSQEEAQKIVQKKEAENPTSFILVTCLWGIPFSETFHPVSNKRNLCFKETAMFINSLLSKVLSKKEVGNLLKCAKIFFDEKIL